MEYELSGKGIDFICQWEGFSSKAYWDANGKKWSVGYGTTSRVTKDTVMTKAEARTRLQADCRVTERFLNSLGLTIRQEQFDALICFSYNVGLGNLKKSTLLKLVKHNAPVSQIQTEFYKWIHSGGKALTGLALRREGEAILYDSGKYPSKTDAQVHIEKRLGKDWKKKLK